MKPKLCVHDIEVYPNFFSDTIYDYTNKEWVVFEISKRRNDRDALVKYYKSIDYLVGFNSIHYDDIHIFWLMTNSHDLNSGLYGLTQYIIERDDYHAYKKWKYVPRNLKLQQIDLYLYWSKMLRQSKMLSLKSLAVQLNHPNIEELPIKPGTLIKDSDINTLLSYNKNDVSVTISLMEKFKDEIKLRQNIQKKYGIKCLSSDSVKIGSDVLLKLYCDELGKDVKEVKELRTQRYQVKLSEIVNPKIKFNSLNKGCLPSSSKYMCKSFDSLLEQILSKTVKSTTELNYSVLLNNVLYDYGSGGLHAFGTKKIYEANEEYTILDLDVGSFYPAAISLYNLCPAHLDKKWVEIYNTIRIERISAKKTDPLKAAVYKLVLNGTFGNFNNAYSWLYDWFITLSTTINCQLFLSMLVERLLNENIEVYTANTDGITCYVKRTKIDKYYEVCSKWEKDTGFQLEYEEYKKTVMTNVNNYIWIKNNNKTKKKGIFVTEPVLGNSNDFLIIPKALEAYFVHEIIPEKFIPQHDNIFDFCAAKKVNKSYSVLWNGTVQQQLNRYYVSKSGAYLYKQKGENPENMLKGYAVQIYNKHVKKPMGEYKIDYQYYISKVREIINDLEPTQKTLF